MNVSVIQAVEQLPTSGLTVQALQVLDRIVPGEWANTTSFDALIREVSGQDKASVVASIRQRSMMLEAAGVGKYAQAVKIYGIVDTVDQVAAGAAVASKAVDLFGNLGFLQKFTPKPETTQAVDAGLKLIAELLAFGRLQGVPTSSPDDIARFIGALTDYAKYDRMRIAAWVVFDGVIPLGPEFITKVVGTWRGLASGALTHNPAFDQLAGQLPGKSADDKREFITTTLDATGDWVQRFVDDNQITQQGAMSKIQGALGVAAGGMDYVAAALDASTSYFAHTGTQTVARALARHAYDQLRDDVWDSWLSQQK